MPRDIDPLDADTEFDINREKVRFADRFRTRYACGGRPDGEVCCWCGADSDACECEQPLSEQAKEHAQRCHDDGPFWIDVKGWDADRIEIVDHALEKHDCVLVTSADLNGGRAVVARDYVEASIFVESECEREGTSEMQKFAAHKMMGFSPESFKGRGIA